MIDIEKDPLDIVLEYIINDRKIIMEYYPIGTVIKYFNKDMRVKFIGFDGEGRYMRPNMTCDYLDIHDDFREYKFNYAQIESMMKGVL